MSNMRKHLTDSDIDKLILENPEVTIRGYLDIVKEIDDISKTEPIEKYIHTFSVKERPVNRRGYQYGEKEVIWTMKKQVV